MNKNKIIWKMAFDEINDIALDGATLFARVLYDDLRMRSDNAALEGSVKTTQKQLREKYPVGSATITATFKELAERKLIKMHDTSRNEGIVIDFIFEYAGATIVRIDTNKGRKLKSVTPIQVQQQESVTPDEVQGEEPLTPDQVQHTPDQVQHTPDEVQYIMKERERESYIPDDALRRSITKHLADLNVFDKCYLPILDKDYGPEFVESVITRYPGINGKELLPKIGDEKNYQEFLVTAGFRRQASQMPNGTILRCSKTGEIAEWEWDGDIGRMALQGDVNETVMIDTLARFKAWHVVEEVCEAQSNFYRDIPLPTMKDDVGSCKQKHLNEAAKKKLLEKAGGEWHGKK